MQITLDTLLQLVADGLIRNVYARPRSGEGYTVRIYWQDGSQLRSAQLVTDTPPHAPIWYPTADDVLCHARRARIKTVVFRLI